MTAPEPPRALHREALARHALRPLDARLARALLRREWRATALAAAALAVAGAALGRSLATRGLLPEPANPAMIPLAGIASLQDFALWLLSRALPLPVAVAAGVMVVDRLAADGDAPWLATLAAAGLDRGRYLAVVAAAVASSAMALYASLALGYVAGAAWGGQEGVGLMVELVRGAAGVAALLASTTLYGAACVAIARRRGPALALALAGVVGPITAVSLLAAASADGAGAAPSPAVLRLLTLAMPPASWSRSVEVLLRHALYCLVLLALLTRSAPRWVARHG